MGEFLIFYSSIFGMSTFIILLLFFLRKGYTSIVYFFVTITWTIFLAWVASTAANLNNSYGKTIPYALLLIVVVATWIRFSGRYHFPTLKTIYAKILLSLAIVAECAMLMINQ